MNCSKGTYIRSLAMDIGAGLGCGAHLAALRRTAIGGFGLPGAVTLEALEAAGEGGRDALLAPVDALVADFPVLRLDDAAARGLLQGRALALAGAQPGAKVRAYGPDGFLGLAQWQDDGRLAARRLIATGSLVEDVQA
ncbi:MAG: tRNA pseudouridine(55) synthase TruB [Thauera sp.]